MGVVGWVDKLVMNIVRYVNISGFGGRVDVRVDNSSDGVFGWIVIIDKFDVRLCCDVCR